MATVPAVIGRHRPGVVAVIAVGRAVGALARYGVANLVSVAPDSFPWATLVINLTGSIALGAVVGAVLPRFASNPYLKPLLATGFLGAYTTFSTFSTEIVLRVKDGHPGLAAVYALASLAGGISAATVGLTLGRRTLPT